MITSYARAGQVIDEPRYLEIATRSANFVRAKLYDPSRKILYRSYREGRSNIEGFADDYAMVIQGFLDLYEASFDVECLKFAIELQDIQDRLFFDEKNGGYFSSSGRGGGGVVRVKKEKDGGGGGVGAIGAVEFVPVLPVVYHPK